MRTIEDNLRKHYDKKEDVITVFLALQRQNFALTNSLKHLIECHCSLIIYKKRKDTVYHKFPVYSKLDKDNNIIEKIVQCNNCGVVHKITDLCKSEILNKGNKNEKQKSYHQR